MSPEIDIVQTAAPVAGTADQRRTGRWIDEWNIEDPEFWESTGKAVARRNLIWSIFAEHLGFSVWLLWSVSAALFGSAFPTTIYIGHPGWKALGARAGYSILNGAFVTTICVTGSSPSASSRPCRRS